ncbi:hypothetical protein PGB28_15585 [Primorskyibacter aestuariivivens]|uniref:MoaD/ThiS family protein n=1 Tax=Primorskyibacter aestuariivivens TaxID=1888912 RepID=UPI0023015A77|nr:hypothetical protein [Primorskyibacter aestuariivivens]MDA7429886.1 hypothetical protein [Primorskyibacter aestuariivivens]
MTNIADGSGHNSKSATVTIESRLFNSLTKYRGHRTTQETFTLPAGSTVRDVLKAWGLPINEVFLCLCNGRDVTPGLVGAGINADRMLDDGDVVAFSGPVPYSYGYGAPVV